MPYCAEGHGLHLHGPLDPFGALSPESDRPHRKTLPRSLGIQTQLARLRFLAPGVAGTFFAPTLTIGEASPAARQALRQLGVPPWTGRPCTGPGSASRQAFCTTRLPGGRADRRRPAGQNLRVRRPVGGPRPGGEAARLSSTILRGNLPRLRRGPRRRQGHPGADLPELRSCMEAGIGRSRGDALLCLPINRRGTVQASVLAHPGGRGGNIACVLCGLRPLLQPAPGSHASHGRDAFLFLGACIQGQRGSLSDPDLPGDAFPVAGGVRAAPGHSQMPPGNPARRGGRRKSQDGSGRPCRDKRTFWPKLRDLEIAMKEALLVYMPFRARGGELIQPADSAGDPRKALLYGLNI